jgi:predicted nuclease of restriction endonuclease-like RecB superfamily
MLTGKLVRVRHSRNRLIPAYLDVTDRNWREVAGLLLEVFRDMKGKTRGEMEDEVRETVGDNPTQLVHQGLAKLLEDRCEFEVDSELAPDELREKAFLAAAVARQNGSGFDRAAVLNRVAAEAGTTPDVVDRGLFADLKSEQRCVTFEDITVDQLLHRYNVALAQAILLRSTGVTVQVFGETPARYRQLFRAIKFHRLICDIQPSGPEAYTLRLDGPLSLFSATQKYGLQLALFLPTLLQCRRFDLTATIRWGAQRKEKVFALNNGDGLRSHAVDYGDYTPKELIQFAESFQKSVPGWELTAEAEVVALPSGYWAPDYQLVHSATGQVVRVEILGFWRRTDAEKLYRRLVSELAEPFVLAVSEQFNIDESSADEWGGHIYRFKRTPLPAEVVRLAEAQLAGVNPTSRKPGNRR